MILTLDPSSTRTGYVVAESLDRVIDHGVLVPDAKADRWGRVRSMAADLRALLAEYPAIREVVIEVPDGKLHWGKQASGSLSIYGAAVGVMLCECWRWQEISSGKITLAEVNDWTNSSRKEARQIVASERFGYDPRTDAGGDLADALCLLFWRMEREAFGVALSLAKKQARRLVNRRKVVKGIFTGAST